MVTSFVIHYSKLYKRKELISRNLEFTTPIWVTEKDFFEFKESDLNSKNVLGLSSHKLGIGLGINSRSLVYSRRRSYFQAKILSLRSKVEKKPNYVLGSLPTQKKLMKQWLEVQRMHLTALEKGVGSSDEWILILEDDAVFNSFDLKNSIDHITNKFSPASKYWFNLNSGAGLAWTKSDPKPDKFGFYRVKPPSVRCAVAYFVSAKLSIEILELIEKYGLPNWLPIDLIYQAAVQKLKAKTYWQDPPSVLQGSESGHFESGFEQFR